MHSAEGMTPDQLQEKIAEKNKEIDTLRDLYKAERGDHTKTKEVLESLRNASNNFRLLMFTLRERPRDTDGAYFFHLKDHWNVLPVEVVMDFLELFEKHFNLASEIVRERKGRDAIKIYNKAKLEEGLAEAQRIRELPAKKAAEKQVKQAIAESDKKKRKAIEGLMRALNCDEETARGHLTAMVGKVNF